MNIIVAVDKNWGIGYKEKTLYNFAKHNEFFGELTTNKVFVLGRKTLDMVYNNKAPKGRINICLTSKKNYKNDGAIIVNTLNDLFEKLSFYNPDNVFVIGGESMYNQLLPYCKYCYVTKIDGEKQSDAYIENLDKNKNWKMIKNSNPFFEDNTIFYFCKYENSKPLKFNFGYEKEDLF